ncbi:MAG: PAS domain-containing protein [Actinobacteria bacterium]|nr:PAS domain-containing protein [Actinomycetota bacterium]MBU1943881.1 PAS domain-containing protein [Actinomycetota bacterium]MBU2688597.1 PAS domain-containing protein [Actinomycetota bacterium]
MSASRDGEGTHSPDGPSTRGDLSHLLFVTARPAIQVLWTVLVATTLVYTFARGGPKNYLVVGVLIASYLLVIAGNRYFPFEEYHPYVFFLFVCVVLVLMSSLTYLMGNRESLLAFLFFTVPIFAAAYYSYPGTMLVALLTAAVRYLPFMTGSVSSLEHVSLALSAVAYVMVGLMACYIVEGEKMYARESSEYRHLLELSRDKERDVSLIYNLSRRFSYTLDLDTILKTTAALARKMLSSEGALVFLVEGGRPGLKAALGTLPFVDVTAIALPEEPWVSRLLAGNNVIAEKVRLEWVPLAQHSRREHYDVAAVPMLIAGDAAGYLMCFSSAGPGFKESHLSVLSTLASQAAIAVEKARLYATTLDEKTKIQTILEALRDGLILTDGSGVVVEANPVALQMLGIEGEVAGGPLVSLLSSHVTSADIGPYSVHEAVEAVLEGRTIFGELSVRGESRVTVQAHFIPLRDQVGRVSGSVLFLHDITELRRVDEMKSNFVSNVSHELRTPLTSISGYVSLLLAGRAGTLNAQQSRYLEVVREQATNLTNLIEELLALSRLRARRLPEGLPSADLESVARSVLEQLGRQASDREIELRLKVPNPLPPVAADPSRLAQVFTNIVDNAIKFSDSGGLVEISALENGPVVQVQISDRGAGIPRGALPHIFDRFFQARSGDAPDQGGFGLGLAISREIVELYGGKIRVESEPGFGSAFYFTVPVSRE